jgi:hypothetical protein
MEWALVETASVNEGGLHLYRACGFDVIDRELWFSKPLA